MDHGHGLARGGGHDVQLGVDLRKGLLQHNHGENRRTGGYVARAGSHAIGGNHARARVALRRAEGYAGLQVARGVQQLGTGFGEPSGLRACGQQRRQQIGGFPGQVVGGKERLILGHALRVVLGFVPS